MKLVEWQVERGLFAPGPETASVNAAVGYLLAWVSGFLFLLSMAGWGTLLGRATLRGELPDFGLRAGWGVALALCVGGFANLAAMYSAAATGLFLLLGGLALFVHHSSVRMPLSSLRPSSLRGGVSLLRLAAGGGIGGVCEYPAMKGTVEVK